MLFCLSWVSLSQAQNVYDAHYNAVTGNSEVIGLGGAYRAAANSIVTAPLNPAGLSLMPGWWNGNFSFGTFKQTLRGLPTGISSKESRVLYFDAGLGFKFEQWKDLAFGLYFNSPFVNEITGEEAVSNSGSLEEVKYEFSYATFGIPVSVRWTDKLSTGVNFKLSSATTNFSTLRESSSASAIGAGFDIGAIYKMNERASLALVYYFGQSLGFEGELQSVVDGFQPFREARTPHRLYFGYARDLSRRFQLLFDWGVVFPLRDSIRPGTGISDNVAEVKSGRKVNFPYHLGLNFLVFPGVVEGRVGHYWQPSRANREPQRFHITGGLDYFFWYLKVGVGIDVANDFNNFSFSIAPSFSHRERKRTQSFDKRS